jgi:maleylacetoacetate isomerase
MSDLVLYNYFRSSASYRVRIALHWKGLAFKYEPIHLLNDGGEQHKPQYRALNPAGEVPTLIHGKRVISQSLAILQYLDEVFTPKPLFPSEAYQKAQIWQFCEIINCTQPLQNLKVLQYLEAQVKISPEMKTDWLNRWVGDCLVTCEKILSAHSGNYCFGDQVSAADVFLIPQLFVVKRFEIDIKPYPNIQKVQKNCESLDAFLRGHPFRQPDTPPELRQ